MNTKTALTFSILFIGAPIALLSASAHIVENQQVFAVNNANPGNVGHLYQGGIPGYPYFGGYPNYGGYPYITYGHPYDTGGDHSYDYGYGYPYITGYGHPYGGDHSYDYGYGGHHHHYHHHHSY